MSADRAWTFESDVEGLADELHDAIGDGLQDAAELILRAANVDVPTESEALRRSGKVDVDRAEQLAGISYGEGESAAYAVHQHEDLELHHETGTAKWLENAMNTKGDQAMAVIAARIRPVLGGS